MKNTNNITSKELKEFLELLKKENKILKKEIDNLHEQNREFCQQINILKSYNKILKEQNQTLISEKENQEKDRELTVPKNRETCIEYDYLNLTEV